MSDDVLYCAEQIKIPPTFPNILKLYAKAAIRTQPYDLLRWTCAYFRALACDELPPVKVETFVLAPISSLFTRNSEETVSCFLLREKLIRVVTALEVLDESLRKAMFPADCLTSRAFSQERLEYPPFVHPTGITPGYLKTLLNSFGPVERVSLEVLLEKWQGMSLPEPSLYQILMVGQLLSKRDCNFSKFLAIACGFLGKNLFETMIYVCELLTEEPEGGSAMILLPTFLRLYAYLAKLDCSGVRPCICSVEDTEEILQPCGPPSVSDETPTGTSSSLYRLDEHELEEVVTAARSAGSIELPAATSSRVEHKTEQKFIAASSNKLFSPYSCKLHRTQHAYAEELGTDVCRLTSSDSRSSGILTILKDSVPDPRPSEPPDIGLPLEGVQMHPAVPKDPPTSSTEPIVMATSKSEPMEEQPENDDPTPDETVDFSDVGPDSLYTDFGQEQGEVSVTTFDELDDYVPIGLEDILRGICECLEPVREPSREPTPPPPDPFGEFLERMKTEQDEGRLPTVFRVSGIGPPVCASRVTAVGMWLTECARRQEGLVGPRNIRHFMCPDLQEVCADDISDY
ncbi:uncharacterized protein LOC143361571 [Halictus rubicundus]|uniref:uncharacterized protein LOC143361571 n=1 Tax=Halictus rubicundus TaxID=77578 RepID=UPI004035D1D9